MSKLYEKSSNPRNFTVDKHIAIIFSGLSADARQLVNRAREEAANYRTTYGSTIPLKILAERIANYAQVFTLYSHVRPFGASIIIGTFTDDKPEMYVVDPSGVSVGYFGCAVGKGRQAANTEVEKLKLGELTMKEAVHAIAKIIHTIHDDVKDKEFILEMSWVGKETQGRHRPVPDEIIQEASEAAKKALEDDSDDDMEE
ncbi:proteasome subunit alpha type-3 [Sphaeroforma arctica JP610]|uniref:Proteasome subunit alpha type-3 n=1 Tax=Sphaeroforma arctica JP610 TaxID=667725 RepID=A0A0L0FZ00_9EUKA|nr:proteasome subunit alpha type-3 [Sphaeroforma arctica JP610]KNC81183.1 proteasome subunit alpha type-3 [Sphaeroforma arctica JP610]|eukprot:XP_014155085.1 proteasome subunit alpha type-3 [Sphaeroforma arctica JP610]